MNSDSWISKLQEIMVKKKIIPNYELIHDGSYSKSNVFSFRVTCDELSAVGTGPGKKFAKSEAARILLEKIPNHKKSMHPTSPKEQPPSRATFINAVGKVQDYCSTNNLPTPKYTELSISGPDHAREFTIRCTVGSFTEDGVGLTKKRAKQEAAIKMFGKISGDTISLPKNVNNNNEESKKLVPLSTERNNMLISNELLKVRYLKLSSKSRNNVFSNCELNNYVQNLKRTFDRSNIENIRMALLKLGCLLQENNEHFCGNIYNSARNEFIKLLSSVNISLNTQVIPAEDESDHIVLFRLNTMPAIVEIGVAKSMVRAEAYALLKLIDNIMLLLM